MQKIKRMLKALKCIEAISENEGMRDDKSPYNVIYRLAHAGRSPSCRASHPSWEAEIEDTYSAFLEER